jgi:hypothetical protein
VPRWRRLGFAFERSYYAEKAVIQPGCRSATPTTTVSGSGWASRWGVPEHMDGAFFTAPFYPPAQLLFGIVVNKAGQRFVNEDGYHARTAAYLFEQPDSVG